MAPEVEELLLDRLQRQEAKIDRLEQKVDQLATKQADDATEIKVAVAGLKVRSSVWGAAAGLLGALTLAAALYIKTLWTTVSMLP